MRIKILSIIIVFILSFPVFSNQGEKCPEKINSWLRLGPAPVTLLENRVYSDNRAIADHNYMDVGSVVPKIGKNVQWISGTSITWVKDNVFNFKPATDSIFYFATYPDAYKRLGSVLILKGISGSFIDIYFDGRKVKKSFDKKKGIVKAELDMLNSKHILLLKIFVPGGKEFVLDASVEDGNQIKEGSLVFSTEPDRRVNFRNIINMVRVSDAKLSPNGRLAFLTLRKTGTNGKTIKWNEILKISSGEMIFSTEGSGSLSGVRWLKDSRSVTYTITLNGSTSLFKLNILNGKREELAGRIKDFSTYWWSPDNSYLIYTRYFKKDTGKGFKFISEIPERSQSRVYNNSIHLFFPKGRITHKIGTKEDDFGYVLISPDSRKVILQKTLADNRNRPYYKNILFILDIKTLSLNKFFESNFVTPVMWAPDSKKILFSGGPSAFKKAGLVLANGVIPNDYDTQLYIFDPISGKADPITKQFDPSVNGAFWANKNNLYLSVTEGSYENLYKYSIPHRKFTQIKTSVDVTGHVWFSKNGKTALFWGSGSSTPYKLFKTDLNSGRSSILKDYNNKDFRNVKFGKVESWNYNDNKGKTIYGRIYYPVSFNKIKKYPCIVYYYGGTSPVERSFGGRYPFNWYAANGYIVYVLQPSGTVGYGQKFSAVHVNDWGKITSAEVIAATEEFLKTHSCVDPERVGAMGASYGGFLTQYLATQTDIFSAFISHAGISALSSYWGVGDWGYTYSGIATAGSFPWNRKDIYVEHSPLFMADKINTPLLLLHGDKDNNVPPGESYQMYAALKLLGKEVALITIDGQSHWILDYSKRVRWMKTIIAWFDKWLKNDSFYWDKLYGKYIKRKTKK